MSQEQLNTHTLDMKDVFAKFNTSEAGLDTKEALERTQKWGANTLPMASPKPAWRRFLGQLNSVLLYVLIVSAVVSALLQHYIDSGVILAVVIINAIMGFIQEGKAEDALRAIMTMTKTHCMVVREGILQTIDSAQLVAGDVVMLQAGDRVPADIRLFFCKELRCDESALTGEAQPATKRIGALPEHTPLAEQKNTVFMGTMVTYGQARGVVTHTGSNTQMGQISDLVVNVKLEPTPLQQQLGRFAGQVTIGIIVVSIITMVLGILIHNYPFSDMLQAAIGVAVASIPEGLPAVVTIVLAIGVQRMAKNNALVRRLPAVEVLGSVDVICSDKTGTLTANAMTAREVYTGGQHLKVSGEGYGPDGSVADHSTGKSLGFDSDTVFSQACDAAMLCNDASVVEENHKWILHGDPTEGALLVLAKKHGLNESVLNREWPRVDMLPFESEKRYMATLHHHSDGAVKLMVKGAPERIINYAKYQLTPDGMAEINQAQWQQVAEDYAKKGMRVMALAMKSYDAPPGVLSHQEAEHDLVMLALVGISDPPRPQAIASIKMCHRAGIRVKMITGDGPVTAAAIGEELGLNISRVMTGQDIDALTQVQLVRAVEQTDIFARTSPANKLQLVAALQHNKHVVAMTGDGVNDAPALKKANVGVAMGAKGTDAAKDAADFVLTDDNFTTIVKAVSEGRTVYDNILKSIIFLLPTSLAEALVIIAAVLLGWMMPITPAQILWVNMVTAITLAIALAFEASEKNIMEKPPRPFGQGLLSFALVVRTVLVGGLGALVVFSLFNEFRNQGASIEYSRTIAVNALVLIEVFYLFNCRYLTQSIFHRDFFVGSKLLWLAAAVVIAIQIVFTYLPISQTVFGLENIGIQDWGVIILATLPVMLIVEIEKWLQRQLRQAL
jgi:magnesium-transporting ATPase (P-type)